MSKGDKRRPSSVSKEDYDKAFKVCFGVKKGRAYDSEAEVEGDTPDEDRGDSSEGSDPGPGEHN